MSKSAIAYVHSRDIADEKARRVFLAVAEQTKVEADPFQSPDIPVIFGLDLWDAEIPVLAQQAGLGTQEFRSQLRTLKQHVRMDVLEHSDGLWEIVYGPSYTQLAKPRPPKPDLTRGGPHPFWMPGWEQSSIWGYEEGLGHLYAQLFANQDDPDVEPRIWITPPRYLVRNVDELAAAIAGALAPYVSARVPAALVKSWLTTPPFSAR
ncbi:hypothetical protein ACQEVM_38255 [Streptomyces sp. CA-243310]|uniref:hypothetical protein n=1 Tax=Streptomyces sp. CA-243310 TaxID=3240056 RepID=UPI003D8CD58A